MTKKKKTTRHGKSKPPQGPAAPEPGPSRSMSAPFLKLMVHVHSLVREGQWEEAMQRIAVVDQRYPNRPEVLAYLVNIAYELKDFDRYQDACERLLRLDPENVDAAVGLAGAYMANHRPVLSAQAFRHFVEKWPDDPRAPEARKALNQLMTEIENLSKEYGLPLEETLEVATLHHQMQNHLEQGRPGEARKLARQLLERAITPAPILNTISQVLFDEGKVQLAIDTTRKALEKEPDNTHVLSNLVHYLCVAGHFQEAGQYIEPLKASKAQTVNSWLKKAEALMCLGDDRGVLGCLRGAQEAGLLQSGERDALLHHLAAVAALRQGQEGEARQLWEKALKLDPGLDLARQNLEDLRQPVGERHVPWPFPLTYWISPQLAREMVEKLAPVVRKGNESGVNKILLQLLKEHPEIKILAPILLDRGDPAGRDFAIRAALSLPTREMMSTLQDFALGQRGPDQLRLHAAQKLSEAGLLPSPTVSLWLQGKWQPTILLNFDVNGEPLDLHHSPEVLEWANQSRLALRDGNLTKAEDLLKQTLEVEPDAPDLLDNLAAIYANQGRTRDATPLIYQIHERHPDYLFGRTNLAEIYVREGKIQEAQELINPIFFRKVLHFSEFASLATAQIEILAAENRMDAAFTWLDLWSKIESDNPGIRALRKRLKKLRLFQGLMDRVRPKTHKEQGDMGDG